jgi:hypothetical protein
LIPNGGDKTLSNIAKRLLASGAAKDNWGREMAYVRQFGSNFFARAGAEVRDYYESGLVEAKAKGEEPSEFLKHTELRYRGIPDFKDTKVPSWTEASLTPELLEEWWNIVSPEECQVEALMTLKEMWEGALKMLDDVAKVTETQAREGVVRFDRVNRFVSAYRLSL